LVNNLGLFESERNQLFLCGCQPALCRQLQRE
jgi:hypothetical protein